MGNVHERLEAEISAVGANPSPRNHLLDPSQSVESSNAGGLAVLRASSFVPRQLYVQVARKCNLKCTMCGFAAWKSNDGFMSEETFRTVLAQCEKDGVRELIFAAAQGEPFLHPRIFDLLQEAIGCGFRVQASTNGTPFTEERARRLASIPLYQLQFSFAGFDKQSYETIYAGARFEQVSRNLVMVYRSLIEAGSPTLFSIHGVYADSIMSHYGKDEFVARTKAYINSLGIPEEHVKIAVPHNFGGVVEAGLYREGPAFHSHKEMKSTRPTLCPVLLDSPGVYVNGQVTACGCLDSNGDLTLGDIAAATPGALRRGDAFQRIVQAFLDGDISHLPLCSKCDVPYEWGATRYS